MIVSGQLPVDFDVELRSVLCVHRVGHIVIRDAGQVRKWRQVGDRLRDRIYSIRRDGVIRKGLAVARIEDRRLSSFGQNALPLECGRNTDQIRLTLVLHELLIVDKKEKLVLDDRPADGDTELVRFVR